MKNMNLCDVMNETKQKTNSQECTVWTGNHLKANFRKQILYFCTYGTCLEFKYISAYNGKLSS